MTFLVLLTSMILNDLELSPFQIKGFREFFVIAGCDTHFKSELRQNN